MFGGAARFTGDGPIVHDGERKHRLYNSLASAPTEPLEYSKRVVHLSKMAATYFQARNGASDLVSPSSSSPTTPLENAPRSSALSSRITSVLSASYADLDLRDALETLDARAFENTQESRRNLRLDLQQEVILCNGEIVRDFGQVAEVN
jgi:hypothetical protein